MTLSPENTLNILFAEHEDLYSLGLMSGVRPFVFFRGADLRGLDLSSQDLRGLNFDRADVRSANLKGAKFDEGAFNGAYLNSDQAAIIDNYDLTYDQIRQMFETLPGIYAFVEFRSSTLDAVLNATGQSYWTIAHQVGINIATLRKARTEYTVTRETAVAISKFVSSFIDTMDPALDQRITALWKQPAVRLLELAPSGGFYGLSKTELMNKYSWFGSIREILS